MENSPDAVWLFKKTSNHAQKSTFFRNRTIPTLIFPKWFSMLILLTLMMFGYYTFSNNLYFADSSSFYYTKQKYLQRDQESPDNGYFKHPNITTTLSCAQYFDVLPQNWKKHDRVKMQHDPTDLDVSCEAIKARNYFPNKPLSTKESEYPIAYAKIVYKDYLFLEMELAGTYAPQNTYCFAIDKKANQTFKSRLHALSQCFPNVVFTDREYSVDSAGHNMNRAHFACLEKLSNFDWKYVFLLQNFDVAIKTNAEMVQILNWYNGANDVEASPMLRGRVNFSLDWRLSSLGFFQQNSMTPPIDPSIRISFAKGLNQCTLRREMIDYVLNKLNLTKTMDYLDTMKYGVDETLFPTLNAMDYLNVPGGFTRKCIREGVSVATMTRRSNWVWSRDDECKSGIVRHNICIIGVENLKDLTGWPQLFVNKFQADKDFGAFACWREWMHYRIYNHDNLNYEQLLDKKFYKNNLLVKFQEESQKEDFNLTEFNCH